MTNAEKRTKTTKAIKQALVSLLYEYKPNRITKKMVYEKAGIHKTTFNYYFESVEDVLDLLIEDKKNYILKEMFVSESYAFQNTEKILTIVEQLKTERALYMNLIDTPQNKGLFSDISACLFKYRAKDKLPYYSLSAVNYCIEICTAIILLWFKNGCIESHETISMMISKATKAVLTTYSESNI